MITLETALLTALSGVVSALIFVCKLLWTRSEQCESDRRQMREQLEEVKEKLGRAMGRLEAFSICPAEPCPFQRADASHFSDPTEQQSRAPRGQH